MQGHDDLALCYPFTDFILCQSPGTHSAPTTLPSLNRRGTRPPESRHAALCLDNLPLMSASLLLPPLLTSCLLARRLWPLHLRLQTLLYQYSLFLFLLYTFFSLYHHQTRKYFICSPFCFRACDRIWRKRSWAVVFTAVFSVPSAMLTTCNISISIYIILWKKKGLGKKEWNKYFFSCRLVSGVMLIPKTKTHKLREKKKPVSHISP